MNNDGIVEVPGVVRAVSQGKEDHGIYTVFVDIECGWWTQGFGGYNLNDLTYRELFVSGITNE